MPVEDRAADTWEPLIAVADLAGGDWPDARPGTPPRAHRRSRGRRQVLDRVRLLADFRTAFTTPATPAPPTTELLDRLNGDPEAPWADSGPTGLTGMRLGDLLREFGITLHDHPVPGRAGQGLHTARDFADAWNRLLPHPRPADGVSRPSRTSLISAGQRPRRIVRPWYGSSRPTDQASYGPDQRKRGWYGWYGLPEPVPRHRRCRMNTPTNLADHRDRSTTITVRKALWKIPEAMPLLSMSRTVIYEQIRAGRLRTVTRAAPD